MGKHGAMKRAGRVRGDMGRAMPASSGRCKPVAASLQQRGIWRLRCLIAETGVAQARGGYGRACIIEAAVALSLLSNVLVRYFGILGAVHLLVAGAAVYIVSKGKWFWNMGGFEYCVFWAICCVAVAIDA